MESPILPDLRTTAELRADGVPRSRLRSDRFQRVGHGLYAPAGVELDRLGTRIAVAGADLGDGVVVGGWAAAYLLEQHARPVDDELTVFHGFRPEMDPASRVAEPVLLCAPRSSRVVARSATRVFRSDLDEDERGYLDGVPITTACRTAFDLARLWPEVAAVVALDRLLRLGLIDKSSVGATARRRRRWRGVRRALRALELADGGAESPRESMLRLLWCAAGAPRPTCNAVVRGPDGRFVARVDLLDARTGVVGEYDGEHHAGAARRRADAVRQEQLEDLGLVVVRASDPDVSTAAGRTAWRARLTRAYRRADERRAPRRWRAEPPELPRPREVRVEPYGDARLHSGRSW